MQYLLEHVVSVAHTVKQRDVTGNIMQIYRSIVSDEYEYLLLLLLLLLQESAPYTLNPEL